MTISSSQQQEIDGRPLSGWWKRFAAYLIDGLLISIISALILIPLGIVFIASESAVLIALFFFILFLAIFAIPGVYFGWSMARAGTANGQSPGKQLLSIAVYREDQQDVDFWYAVKRQVLIIGIVIQVASAFTGGIAYFLNYLWPLWDDKRQAFHDKMVGSRVVIVTDSITEDSPTISGGY